jgi:ribonuclease E
MLINVSQGEECRIALVEDGRLEELYMERTSATSHVGNIYKGRVTNVEASIQAAFIDFGLGRNGFLHISDLMPNYFGRDGADIQESVGRKLARRDRPPIQRCLRRGDEIIVQIIKEGIGTKGPTLSTYLSVPGRILVMMPGMARMGVSKKIEDEVERRRLRQILDSLKPPKDVGFIIRTAGIGKSKAEIQRDLTYLARVWTGFVKKRDSGAGPMELYTEGDLVTRTVRDVFTSDVDQVIVDDKEVAKRVKEVIKLANPRTKNKVELYEDPVPLFHKYGIEREIEQMYSRHVPLPSGGSLVIDSTEAIVAIDVNSGKFRDHSDAETTAFKTDMEAADEIPRQLRLRDLGGVIICDFIDLRYERHRRELEGRLHANFQKDRAKTKVLRMSQFGIIELTRQRMRPSLKRSIYFDCPHCKGAGLVKTPESMGLDVMRRLAMAINDARVARVELSVASDVSFYLQNRKRAAITELEQQSKKRVIIRTDPNIAMDEMKLELFDARDGLVYLAELGMSPADAEEPRQPFQKGRGGRDRGRHSRSGPPRRDQRLLPHQQPPSRRDQHGETDRYDMEEAEDQADRREQDEESGSSGETSDRSAPEGGLAKTHSISIPNLPNRGNQGRGDQGRGGRRGRGGRGRGRDRNFDQGPQPQEQAVGGGEYVEEYDLGDSDAEADRNAPPRRAEPHGDSRGPALGTEGTRGPRVLREPEPPESDSAFPEEAGDSEDSAVGEADGQPSGNAQNFGDEPRPGRRRRRGRRGGRGRRRGGAPPINQSDQSANGGNFSQSQPPPLPVQDYSGEPDAVDMPLDPEAPEPGNEAVPPMQDQGQGGPGRRRRRRGGRGRGRGRNGQNDSAGNDYPQAQRLPPPPLPAVPPPRDNAPRAAEAPTLTRTGSADKHLVHDEPAEPQPVHRPKTYRDLDSIPDDFD